MKLERSHGELNVQFSWRNKYLLETEGYEFLFPPPTEVFIYVSCKNTSNIISSVFATAND